MADPLEAAPWTIKNMPVEIRQKAVKAAGADDQSVAQFLTEAVELLIDKRAGNVVIPPHANVPPPLTPDQITQRMMAVAALQQSTAALRTASGRASGRGTLRLALVSLEQRLVEAEGGEPIRVAQLPSPDPPFPRKTSDFAENV